MHRCIGTNWSAAFFGNRYGNAYRKQKSYCSFNDPTNDSLWEFLAYCTGTGGSVLIIGSAAGVAVMGMAKVDFFWYLKHISWVALLGYFAGALTFYCFKRYNRIRILLEFDYKNLSKRMPPAAFATFAFLNFQPLRILANERSMELYYTQ